jgi:demethylmenaquinone methyltransferase/2-methoxy-6-polyprenyl-1,4-benzoquinol methylase
VTKSLRERLATPDSKRRVTRAVFATIADRYDLITVVLSYGRDRAWKRRLVERARLQSGGRALDLATGTGDIAFGLSRKGVAVIGLDITPRMIELASARRAGPVAPAFVVGDMQALPFPDSSFDVVTTGYGLRNVPDLEQALEEIARVLRPGGRLWSLDFNRPENAIVRTAYLGYLTLVGGVLGWLLHRDGDMYRYIPASIRTYPGAERVARMMNARGFADARYYPVLGGLMAMHGATKELKIED